MPSRLSRSENADRNRFIALYLAMGLGLLVAAGMFLYEARVIVNDGMRDDEAFAVLGAANTVLHNLENAETGQRGYLLTGDESYLLLYHRQGAEDLDDTVLRLQRVVSNDEKIRRAGPAYRTCEDGQSGGAGAHHPVGPLG